MDFDKKGILARAKEAQSSTVVMDEGLRAYMLKVYNYMATGILLTGIIALLSFKMSVVTDSTGAITGIIFTTFFGTNLSDCHSLRPHSVYSKEQLELL